MNLIDKIIKKWYEIPVIKIDKNITKDIFSFGIRIVKKDKRCFQWYQERQTLGFDERELWNLSCTLFDKFYLLHPEFDIKNLEYTAFMTDSERNGVREINTFDNRINDMRCYRTILKNISKYDELINWFYPRMKEYIENECPLSIYMHGKKKYLKYKKNDSGFMDYDDTFVYAKKCLATMEKIVKKETTLPNERKELFLILNQFGW
jgi:hypothetical protein